MPSRTHTFGSDEGFEAVHEAMLAYITQPRSTGFISEPRGAFHTSFNLNDMTQLLNMLEFVMMNANREASEAHAAGDKESAQQISEMLLWVEQYYRDLAGTVGVELV